MQRNVQATQDCRCEGSTVIVVMNSLRLLFGNATAAGSDVSK